MRRRNLIAFCVAALTIAVAFEVNAICTPPHTSDGFVLWTSQLVGCFVLAFLVGLTLGRVAHRKRP